MDIPVSDVSGEVVFDSAEGVFSAQNLSVETVEGWRVRGAYIQDMNTSQYRVRVAGDIRPMAIAHFMEPWWARVMKDFKFGGKSNFPRADVSVEGTWGKPEYIWCYARASGGNAQYSGAKFSSFALHVLVNPERITLFDVDINADGRRASGQIEWLYFGDGITTFDEQRIFFDSELDSRELLALGGDAFVEFVRTQTHTCYMGSHDVLHDWGYGCGQCPACKLRQAGWEAWIAKHRR